MIAIQEIKYDVFVIVLSSKYKISVRNCNSISVLFSKVLTTDAAKLHFFSPLRTYYDRECMYKYKFKFKLISYILNCTYLCCIHVYNTILYKKSKGCRLSTKHIVLYKCYTEQKKIPLCVLGVSFLPLSTIFLLDFRNGPTV